MQMQVTAGAIQAATAVAALAGAAVIAAVRYFVRSEIKLALDRFGSGFFERLNKTYVRRRECVLICGRTELLDSVVPDESGLLEPSGGGEE